MKVDVKRNLRKLTAFIIAVISYFFIHEGAHFIYAKSLGVFKQINFMSLGVQIEADTQLMTETQLGIFCIVGAVSTLIIAYTLLILTGQLLTCRSLYFKAMMYYITITLMMTDPIYLSVIYPLVGGGDMNGIALLMPETFARILFGAIAVINMVLLFKVVLPKYKAAYNKSSLVDYSSERI